jgi:hypothetical protein
MLMHDHELHIPQSRGNRTRRHRAHTGRRGCVAAAVVGAAALLAACSHGSTPAGSTAPDGSVVSAAPAGTSQPTSAGSSASLRVLHAYRIGCQPDGTSSGLGLDVEVTGYSGQLLSAGAATNAAPDPLVAVNIRPTSADWRHLITLTPLGGAQDRIAAGNVRVNFGMATASTRAALLPQSLPVTVPSSSAATCIKA